MVKGPRPVAINYKDFLARAWGPLLARFGVENAFFQMLLNPQLAPMLLHSIGWESFASTIEIIVQFGPVTYMMGVCGDVITDFGVVKLPIVKDYWPQMPPPLPQPVVVEAQVVKQTTEVTQLQTTTVTPDVKP